MSKVLLLLTFVALCNCFVFSVEASKQECFYEHCEANSNIKMMFQVLEGGNMDIDFTVCAYLTLCFPLFIFASFLSLLFYIILCAYLLPLDLQS